MNNSVGSNINSAVKAVLFFSRKDFTQKNPQKAQKVQKAQTQICNFYSDVFYMHTNHKKHKNLKRHKTSNKLFSSF